MEHFDAGDLVTIAQKIPIEGLPKFLGRLAEASAIAHMRLLTPPPVTQGGAPQLIDRRTAAAILGVSRFFLENKRLPCQVSGAGRKVLYNKQQLQRYIEKGHIPYEDR
jgi:hypothetical protein